jgi:hypothetical protein
VTTECRISVRSENREVGFNYIKVADMILSKNETFEYSIFYDNKPAGVIKIRSEFLPKYG